MGLCQYTSELHNTAAMYDVLNFYIPKKMPYRKITSSKSIKCKCLCTCIFRALMLTVATNLILITNSI